MLGHRYAHHEQSGFFSNVAAVYQESIYALSCMTTEMCF